MSAREDILARYLELAEAVKTADITIKSVVRNRGPRQTDARPCLVLLDGDESTTLPPPRTGRGGQRMPPFLATMTPELFILLEEARPNLETVGTRLNAYRDALLKAVALDDVILSLITTNGRVQYLRMATDLKSGSALAGEMRLDFAFTYLVNPAAL
jgi:hypothetical protein